MKTKEVCWALEQAILFDSGTSLGISYYFASYICDNIPEDLAVKWSSISFHHWYTTPVKKLIEHLEELCIPE